MVFLATAKAVEYDQRMLVLLSKWSEEMVCLLQTARIPVHVSEDL
jgi:hypothetical protein